MTTMPFRRHRTHSFMDATVWVAFTLTAILAPLAVLSLVGARLA